MKDTNQDTRTRILEATWKLMVEGSGLDITLSDVAKEAQLSRQAIYLHFASRTELMIATSDYVDQVKGLNDRLEKLKTAKDGVELIELSVDVWGNYIPEIYGLARAMLNAYHQDEAIAAAWDKNMECLREVCKMIIGTLKSEGLLSKHWKQQEAVDAYWMLLSVHNWEILTRKSGYSNDRYINQITRLLKLNFLNNYS